MQLRIRSKFSLGAALLLTLGTASAQQKGVVAPKPSAPAQPTIAPASGSIPLVGGGDSCSTPDLLVGTGAFPFDTSLATTGTEGQNNASCLSFGSTAIDGDVWFAWSAPTTGVYVINTCSGTALDTKLAVYQASSCPTSVAALVCNDDSCGLESSVTICAQGSETYFIQVGQFPGTPGGAGTLNINATVACAPNDSCQTPVSLGSSTGTFNYNNANATTGTEGQGNALCLFFNTSAITKDLWYSWTAPANGTLTVSTCGISTQDTKLAIYSGAGCPSAAALACSDDDCGATVFTSSADLAVTSGTTYTIQIGIFPNTASGNSSFSVAFNGGPCTNNVTSYCTSLVSSSGCTPTMTATGSASLANPGGFTVSGVNVESDRFGLLVFGTTGQASTPFLGGTLCVAAPQIRLNAKITAIGAACTGTLSYTLAEYLASSGGNLVVVGAVINSQVWFRDAPAVQGGGLTNGIEFTVCP